jgi:hypothetical protein
MSMKLSLVLVALATVARPPAPAPGDLDALVLQLGSESYAERETASRVLEALGPPALPALRAALRSDDAEIRRRARYLVEEIQRRVAARKWAEALAAVRQRGARVRTAAESPGGAIVVDLVGMDLTEALASNLKTLGESGCLHLHISGKELSPAGMARFKGIQGLHILYISLIGLKPVQEGTLEASLLELKRPGLLILVGYRGVGERGTGIIPPQPLFP